MSPDPLKSVLDPQLSERRIGAVWRGVERRLHGQPPRRVEPTRVLVAAGVLTAALFVWWSWPAPPTFLGLEGGGVLASERAEEDLRLVFLDGSSIELSEGAEIQTTRNDATRLELALTRGTARFSVTPGGPRRWRIECGVAEVEVVGTRFVLTRTEAGLGVRVEHGLVRVRAHAGGSWALAAGEDVWVPAPRIAVAASHEIEAPTVRTSEASASPSSAPLPRALPIAPPRATPTEFTSPSASLAEVTEESAAPSLPTATELMHDADEARLGGRARDAVASLERLLSVHGASPEAPLAAVMLARLQQDVLGSPREAARALERARAIGVPASLALDVEGRLALAYLETGDPRGPDLARAYVEAHPEAVRAADLRARLDR